MYHLLLRALACVLLLTSTAPAGAGSRVALVVGNSSYQHVGRLANPINDAKLVAETLRKLGFSLIGGGPQIDVDKSSFEKAVKQFGNELIGAEVGLFYYAGHGVQERDVNYLIPVGANPKKEADYAIEMLSASVVLQQMEASGTKLNVVILDACRNNPFSGRGSRSTAGGLAQMQAPEGTIISYATHPGAVAQDGAGANSPYTSALARAIQKPGVGVIDAFNEIGVAVKRATGGSQQPWLSISPLDGKFFFAGAGDQDKGGVAAQPAFDARALELSYWESVRASGSIPLVQGYLDRYPNGIFAEVARARVQELRAGTAARSDGAGTSHANPCKSDNPPLNCYLGKR